MTTDKVRTCSQTRKALQCTLCLREPALTMTTHDDTKRCFGFCFPSELLEGESARTPCDSAFMGSVVHCGAPFVRFLSGVEEPLSAHRDNPREVHLLRNSRSCSLQVGPTFV